MAELKKGDKDGLAEDDEDVQVILFENASEFRLDQFTTETEPERVIKPNQNCEKEKVRSSELIEEGKSEPTNTDDVEALVRKATKDKKVFMKYDYTNEKMWEHSNADKSMWFNYNFDEHSFKAFVQNYINNAIAKQANYQIENTDSVYENEIHNNRGVETTRNISYRGNENEYVHEDYIRRNNEESSFPTYREKEFYTKENNKNSRIRNGSKIQKGNTQAKHFKTFEDESSVVHTENIQTHTAIGRNQMQHQRNTNQRNVESAKPTNNTNTKKEQTNDIPLGTHDLMQLQNLINFFKQNPNT